VAGSVECLIAGSQTRTPREAREGVLCSPRCFLGFFKYSTFTLFSLFTRV